jgi:hypothetical protein
MKVLETQNQKNLSTKHGQTLVLLSTFYFLIYHLISSEKYMYTYNTHLSHISLDSCTLLMVMGGLIRRT